MPIFPTKLINQRLTPSPNAPPHGKEDSGIINSNNTDNNNRNNNRILKSPVEFF